MGCALFFRNALLFWLNPTEYVQAAFMNDADELMEKLRVSDEPGDSVDGYTG
jgi:hypothetical protein